MNRRLPRIDGKKYGKWGEAKDPEDMGNHGASFYLVCISLCVPGPLHRRPPGKRELAGLGSL
eukprot:2745455-Pyramimonas_sp.AAC.1